MKVLPPLIPPPNTIIGRRPSALTEWHWTPSCLKEVNSGIQSVGQALENVSAKLNKRITNQEQKLNRAVTSFQSVQGSTEAAQANVQHLNDLTETVNQLRGVINTIGTKLGERVDSHEDRLGQLAKRVNRLQAKKVKKWPPEYLGYFA